MELAPDLVVADRFRLIRQLGQGGMGTVWIAHHVELDVECAIKFIEGTFANNAEFRMRFVREARAAAQIKSPHVVHVLDSGVWNDLPYCAMELLEGQDLAGRIAQAGRLAPGETVEVVTQVARALTKAHAAGFVHRDLKPDNIFLTKDDDRLLCKVLDFGIAKQLSAGPEGGTRAGALLGTPYYMSPEQASGAKNVDARSDLWSLAVIVFECLVGQKPFDSEGLGELLVMIQAGPIPVPSVRAPWLPPTFDQWWQRATQRDPRARYQTAKELVEALGFALGITHGVTMSADSRQSGAGSMPMSPAPGTLVQSAPNSPFQATPGPGGLSISQASAPPKKAGWIVPAAIVGVLAVGGIGIFFATRNSSSHNTGPHLEIASNGTAGQAPPPGSAASPEDEKDEKDPKHPKKKKAEKDDGLELGNKKKSSKGGLAK
jgi:serine/threonine protein kinase